jgi:hypothetical protein
MNSTTELDINYIANKAEEANSFLSLDHIGTTSHRSIRLYCGSTGHIKDLKLKCSDRTCDECRKRTYFRLFKGWFKLAEEMKNPKLLTLTTVNVAELTKEHLRFIRSSFVRLMRRKYYKDRILGGLYVVELKNIGKGWNIHLHALIETISGMDGFLLQRKISDDWLEITRHSKIVDIRQAESGKRSLGYILKYLTKTPEINGESVVYNIALKGTRLIQTFGKLYSKRKPEKKKMACAECGCDWWMTDRMVWEFDIIEKARIRRLLKKIRKERALEGNEIYS